MNSMTNTGSLSSKPRQNQKSTQNLVEAFKDQGKAASVGMASTAFEQILARGKAYSGIDKQQSPQNRFQIEQFMAKERQIIQKERLLIYQQRQTETMVFSSKEEFAKKSIESIKEEIKALAVQTGDLSSELAEAEKAIFGQVPDVKSGKYYTSFFERIKNLIKIAKKKITESRTWLGVFNQRCKSKGHYWGQAAKSGSKFTMAHDRSVATSVG